MKSPITGKEMILIKERRSMDFRKEAFEIVFHYYKCEDSGEQFTTTSMDEVNMNQVYNQYRDRFNIPFPDEITRTREKYGLSATKMSEVLGFGVNGYRLYEAGEMPSIANANLIQLAGDPKVFMNMVDLSGSLDIKAKAKYMQRARQLMEETKRNIHNLNVVSYLLGNYLPDIYSGYRSPNLEKFTGMMVYFSEIMAPFKTKMNKLLFYADFLMFNRSGFSMSGMRYKAIPLGPVPNNFQSIFEYLSNKGEIDIEYIEFSNGNAGEKFIAKRDRPFKADLFTKYELEVLEKVAAEFRDKSTDDIIKFSHNEEAWKKNEKNKNVISYEYAFELKQI